MTTTPAARDERQLFLKRFDLDGRFKYDENTHQFIPLTDKPEHFAMLERITACYCGWLERDTLAESELEEVREQLAAAHDKIDKAWNRSTPVLDGFIPGALDAWKRPVKQNLPYDFSGNPGVNAMQYCNGWNDSGGYWKAHVNTVEAERDELRAELERVSLDARRYQAFRNTPSFGTSFGAASTPEQIDKLCDAAICAGEGEAG